MKFDMNFKLGRPNKIQSREIGPLLTLVFLAVLALLGYMLYTQLFAKIFRQPEVLAPSNIVRVDLKSYQETVNLMEELESYIPPVPLIQNNNPFQ